MNRSKLSESHLGGRLNVLQYIDCDYRVEFQKLINFSIRFMTQSVHDFRTNWPELSGDH